MAELLAFLGWHYDQVDAPRRAQIGSRSIRCASVSFVSSRRRPQVILVDANIPIYAQVNSFKRHQMAHEWLDQRSNFGHSLSPRFPF
jgi:hypothetical protein